MKLQKEELNKVKLGKGGDIESQAVIGNVKMLSTNLNKIGEWIENEIMTIEDGTESNGSSVANRYLRDIVLTKKTDESGQPLTTMMVDNKHDLAIKFNNTKGTYSLTSIKENVFPKAFESFEQINKALASTRDEAASGAPFNDLGVKNLINNTLKTEEQILSTIHDEESPFFQFLNDFAEGFPNSFMDFAHVDSPNYSADDLNVLVKDYALRKFKEQHSLYSPKGTKGGLTPQQLIEKYS